MKQNKKDKIKKLKNEISELKKEIEVLKKAAYIDRLTNINNRRILDNAEGFNYVVLGDLDDFKNINDEHGHIIGDAVLVAVSGILKASIKSDEIVCRWGGEEFVLLLKDNTDQEAFTRISDIKDTIQSLEKSFDFKITMSFGITKKDPDKLTSDLISEADHAMYESKCNGKNTITVYNPEVKSKE